MSILGLGGVSLPNLGTSLFIRPRSQAAFGTAPIDRRASLRDLAGAALRLRHSVDRLMSTSRVRIGSAAKGLASASSSDPLGLTLEPTSARLESIAEVNATPTSYGPFSPTISGSSTATPILDGVYSGAQGDDVLTFKFKRNGTVGETDFNVEVRRSSGSKIEEISFGGGYVPGEPVTLSNGLILSLSAGTVKRNETFQISVWDTVGSAVDPDKAFDGIGNDRPNLEYGRSVTAGSFHVNGTQIDVLASDTLNTLLSRITSSSAGVVAAFDPETETVSLTQKTSGATGQIVLGGDDTGFFDAAKLAGATTQPGYDSDLLRPIAQVPALAGIGTGTFFVNGVQLSVDVLTDTLADVLDRINTSEAGATASFHEPTGRVVIQSQTPGDPLVLADGSSSLFTALGIEPGSQEAAASAGSERQFTQDGALRAALRRLGTDLRELFSTSFDGLTQGTAAVGMLKLREAISGAFEGLVDDPGGDLLRSGLGIDFDFTDPARGVLHLDQSLLSRSLSRESDALAAFLLGESREGGSRGLLAELDVAVGDIRDLLAGALEDAGSPGVLLDLFG